MAELTPLEKVPGIDDATRAALAAYWIESAEELVSVARSSNKDYGTGLKALARAIKKDDAATMALVQAAMQAAPGASSFTVDVEMEVGDGLLLEGIEDMPTSFATPRELPPELAPIGKDVLPEPLSQGVRNSCVAFTLAACYQALSGDPTDLSEQFLYWVCKDRDGVKGDVGTSPVVALKIMQEVGICTEATWPYKPEPVDHNNPGHERPSDAAFAEAKRRRISSFRQLPGKDVNQIKGALVDGHPVLIGLAIQEHWTGTGQSRRLGKVREPLPGERSSGGHAMAVLGYKDDPTSPGGGYFIVRNSWGAEWANENPDGAGYARVPYKLVFERGLVAFAVEGVAPYQEETSDTSLGASGEAAELPDLPTIYAEAQAIKLRLDALVMRLGAMIGAEAPVAAAAAKTAVEAANVIEAAKTEAATGAAAGAAEDLGGGYSAPMILLSKDSSGTGSEELYPNGIDGTTGQPLLRIDAATAYQLSSGVAEPPDKKQLFKNKITDAKGTHFGTVADINQKMVEQARWAAVVNAHDDAAVIKAAWPLFQRRMEQMGFAKTDFDFRDGENCGAWLGRHTDGYKKNLRDNWGEMPPVLIYRPNDRVNGWLARHGVSNGPVDPRRGVPYYLMLLSRPGPTHEGDQAFIPLNFQYELDVFYAVGRLCFTDENGRHRLPAYSQYSERIAAFERQSDAASRLSKEIVFFGTKHDLDVSTQRSADELIRPMVDWATNPQNLPMKGGYAADGIYLAEKAKRSDLEHLLKGGNAGKPPAMLLTASHGLGLPVSDKRLVAHQGALVTQDWTGFGGINREHWFAAEDMGDKYNLDGTIAFLFACYGAGCPSVDEFVFDKAKGRQKIAPYPFIAQLPQQLLLSGCQAVLGHIERAWTYSFAGTESNTKAQTQGFESIFGRLIEGRPAGDATDDFNVIQGLRSLTLTELLENIEFGMQVDPMEVAVQWMARNDARNYALLGDPAVKLPFPGVSAGGS